LNTAKWHVTLSKEEIMKITDLSLWETFVAVAELKSFAKAGRRLHMGAPTVTKRISMLESQLGVRLFNRTTRVVSLTLEGEQILPEAKQLLDTAHEVERRASDTKNLEGVVRITCLPVVGFRWLGPQVISFQKKHPKIQFQIDLSERFTDLVAEQFDLAIRVQKPQGADFVFRELAQNELVLCASPSYLKKAAPLKKPTDLFQHPLLTLDVFAGCRFMKSGKALRDFDSARTIRSEFGLYLTELALLGGGIAVRSRWDVFPFLASGKLVEVLPEHKLEPFGSAYLVIPQRRYLSPRVRAFADHLMIAAGALKESTQS
jgi:LysR family transcriptional activator of dmlA